MAADQNLREQVLQQVRAEIISGQSAPGTMYSVPSLALSLGVSTTPVREALLELTRAGLIEPMRNRGFKVMAPTLRELHNAFDLRGVVEPHAAAVVARRAPRELDELYPLADEVARAVEREDVREYLESDRRFHHAFNALADNEILTETVMGLRDKMRLYGISTSAGIDRQRQSVAEHYRIIELAKSGEAEILADLVRRHILTWEPIFAEALSRSVKSATREPLTPRRANAGNAARR